MLRKAAWFFGIFLVVFAVVAVLLAMLEPGSTNPTELGRVVGRLIVPILVVTTIVYVAAKRLGWILKGPATRRG